MYIQCTKALLDKLKIEKSELLPAESCEDGAEGFYSWHAHFITINRRKAVVCMNNLTRYTIVLYRAKVKDMMELESRIQEGIRIAFQEEGISEEVISEYIRKCGAAEYSKTAGRSMVANLNKICEAVQWHADLLDEDTVIQKRISLSLGRYLVKCGEDYDYPEERMFRALCKMRNLSESEWNRILEVENYFIKILCKTPISFLNLFKSHESLILSALLALFILERTSHKYLYFYVFSRSEVVNL